MQTLSNRNPVWCKLAAALARRELGQQTGGDVVAWAADALAEGIDTPSLRILAGLESPPNEFEVDRYLKAAADELGVRIPDRAGLVRLLAATLAGEIAAGRRSPEDGAKELYQLFRQAELHDELGVWTGLDDAVSLAKQGIHGDIQEVEKDIVRHARALAERLGDVPGR